MGLRGVRTRASKTRRGWRFRERRSRRRSRVERDGAVERPEVWREPRDEIEGCLVPLRFRRFRCGAVFKPC